MSFCLLRAILTPCFFVAIGAITAFTPRDSCAADPSAAAVPIAATPDRLPAWAPRAGRTRPVVVVVGQNSGTELVDFVVPYGILSDSGVADVIALATGPGALQLRPALLVQPQQTIAGFDDSTPLGADYVIVPAFTEEKVDDPVMLAWLRSQSAKGAIVVSICDGALVVANAGLFDGRRATGHWATDARRRSEHPGTQWLNNIRFVADGNVVSTAGVSAAIPAALALVEAIGGTDVATRTATRLGTAGWSAEHDSDRFHIGIETILTYVGNRYLKRNERLVIPIADEVDEIALALTVDAYGRTMRSPVSIRVGAEGAPVRSLHGLMLLSPGQVVDPLAHELQTPQGPSLAALDRALADIGRRYGAMSRRYVALEMEYAAQYTGK